MHPHLTDEECHEEARRWDRHDAQQHAEKLERFSGLRQRVGVAVPKVFAGPYPFCVAAGLVEERREPSGQLLYRPLIDRDILEVLPVDREHEEWMRLVQAHLPAEQRIVEMFRPNGDRRDEVVTSLSELAELLDADLNDARVALRCVLFLAEDVSSEVNPATVEPSEPIVLRMDCAGTR